MNANAKYQVQSYECVLVLGLTQCQQVLKLLYNRRNGTSVLLLAKPFDDIKSAVLGNNTKVFLTTLTSSLRVGILRAALAL